MAKETKEKKNYQIGKNVKISRSSIVADDYNPRIISDGNAKRLKKNIKDNGLIGPLVWNKTTGHIVGGHQRLDALDSLMRTQDYELEVTMIEVPLKDEVRINVALNNADSQGEFDYLQLQTLADQFDLNIREDFGFSDDSIDINFPDFVQQEIEEMDTPVEPPREANAEEIALMKEKKKETRERLNMEREEYGDWKTEAKGVLTLVYEKESVKKQWLAEKGFDPSINAIPVNDFLISLGLEEIPFSENVTEQEQDMGDSGNTEDLPT